MLKFANLQMAAEALYTFRAKQTPNQTPGDLASIDGHYSGTINPTWLTVGNEHASRFTQPQAEEFVQQWEVVDHISNTTTGFSGTLFRNRANPSELVISFRSTEFIDDTIRDCLATNSMEIDDFGFAFGQIDDMEKWYASLKSKGLLPANAHYSVTGYSLGGHLATAFNLLRREDGTIGNVDNVVTFNGAGVGQVTSGTLGGVIADFDDLRSHPDKIAARFMDARLGAVYDQLRL